MVYEFIALPLFRGKLLLKFGALICCYASASIYTKKNTCVGHSNCRDRHTRINCYLLTLKYSEQKSEILNGSRNAEMAQRINGYENDAMRNGTFKVAFMSMSTRRETTVLEIYRLEQKLSSRVQDKRLRRNSRA